MGKKIVIFSILCLLFLCLNYTYSVFSNKIVGTINATTEAWKFNASVTDGTVFEDGYKLCLSARAGTFKVVLNNTNNSKAASYSIEIISDNLSSNITFSAPISNLNDKFLNNTFSGIIYSGNSKTVIFDYASDSTNNNILVKISASALKTAVMKNGANSSSSSGTEFWNDTYRPYIRTIKFDNDLSNLPSSCTGNDDLCWDVSYDSNQEKRVYAYLVDSGSTDSSSNTLYNLYIVSAVEIFAPTDCSYMFNTFTNLATIDFNNFNTVNVTSMHYMFYNCSSLEGLDYFETSRVTDMAGMFCGCSLLNFHGLTFDTSRVTDMSYMFSDCSSLYALDLSSFDTSRVTDMSGMFKGCLMLTELDISGFNTASVTSMHYMFYDCLELEFLEYIEFDTSRVTDMSGMFKGCSYLSYVELSSFDTSRVTDMSYMFSDCSILPNLDLSSFDTSRVTDMSGMFANCPILTTTIDIMSTTVTSYTDMFNGAATEPDSEITVNYIADASSLVDNMIATKSSNSNVVKGVEI